MALGSVSLTAGMRSNLLSMQNTSALLDRTQERLSTGKKVNSALDDPVSYFAAKAHTDRASDLTVRKDGMNEGIQAIKAGRRRYRSHHRSAQPGEGSYHIGSNLFGRFRNL